MFVKIKYFTVRKGKDKTVIYNNLDREICYDCTRFSIGPEIPEPGKDVENIILTVDVGRQDERTIEFPCEQETEITEIYIMNDRGKTIDKYIY